MLNSNRLLGFRIICWMAVFLVAGAAQAQVAPSAYGPGHSLWVGGEYSNIHAGFPYQSSQRLWGFSVFADYSVNGPIGIEAEARFLHFNSFYDESEDNYLVGPRYVIRKFGRFQPYAKFLVGIGEIQYPFSIGNDSYLALAPAAGASYRLSPRWAIRGEYEYQFWPGSPGFTNEPANQIKPSGLHAGIAFRPFR
jgi:opacity protein-like surface antigen